MQFIPQNKAIEERKKPIKNRFLSHSRILIWKCYLQRRRRWGLLLLEAGFAFILFLLSIVTARPVFLTPLQAEPTRPLGTTDVLNSLRSGSIVGYAPDVAPYTTVMEKAAEALKITNVLKAQTEEELNGLLYNVSKGVTIKVPIIWVIWKPKEGNIWSVSIRSTERALYFTNHGDAYGKRDTSNQYLHTGFLAMQMAISQAIIETSSPTPPEYEVKVVAMPVSPLMEEEKVRRALSGILLCFTLALMPPVLEAQALVVTETVNMFKRALRLRNVDYYSMYVSWIVYGYLSCLPICILASITLILIFRWIHLVEALLVMLAYVSVLIIISYMMAMFHTKASIACIWIILFTLLQGYISELLVHHEYDRKEILTFFWHLILPPMGLLHAFHKFALLQIQQAEAQTDTSSLVYMVSSWGFMNALYFAILMLLQRTIGQKRAIGGQVSWRSVIFKKAKNQNALRKVKIPTASDLEKLQEVDEFLAKSVSFRCVSKTIMEVPVLNDITFDMYRGELNILYTEKIQESMTSTIDDLLTGLTSADSGSVVVLGEKLEPGSSGMMTTPQMMGYCHRSETLIDDLSVQEHFTLFSTICLWNRITEEKNEYAHIRSKLLLKECDLDSVKHERVRNLNVYYKAQLCWALAVLLEPRIIIIPRFTEYGVYKDVIEDKIMEYKKFKTIILYTVMKTKLEYADRVFVFDSKILVFGGTPAYMFFKYGREYQLRLNLKTGQAYQEQKELLERLALAEATVRAHLAYLIIFRLPVNPSSRVAELVKDLSENSELYGLKSFDISVPDIQEVCNRAIMNFRSIEYAYDLDSGVVARQALVKFNEPVRWTRRTCWLNLHLSCIFSKFALFHNSNRIGLVVTFMSAVIAGACMALSMPSVLLYLDPAEIIIKSATLTVENMEMKTTLVLRADNSPAARSIANGYVLSDTGATKKEIENMEYTAMPHTEDLTEYLILRAIDSPQHYVYKYAYGMDVYTNKKGKVEVGALYSPIHHDISALARSLARVYMAILRHYSGAMDATIKIDDDPLSLDFSLWMTEMDPRPPLILELLLILSIWHITFIPSLEYGLIRHLQKHALNFSPIRYWFTMYFCDLLLYWLLVAVMSFIMITIMFAFVPSQFVIIDYLIVPIALAMYGIGCVPQAYIFSLGPQMGINVMTFIIFNLVFSETTILAKLFYGDALSYIMSFMTLSPQFNIVYAYVKIKQIFLYNNECYIFKDKHLCSVNTFHKCCEKCGVLQECFSRKSYFNRDPGILVELTAMITTAIFFTILLLLIEYKIFHQLWRAATVMFIREDSCSTPLSPGCEREKRNVILKEEDIRRSGERLNEAIYQNKVRPTFGDCLLATGITVKYDNKYMVHSVYLDVGKGEAISVSGHKRHGRNILCETLAGYRIPSGGNIWSMSKYKLQSEPHMYSRQVSIACDQKLMPPWMKPREALGLLAALRGVPQGYIDEEVTKHIEALELRSKDDYYISDIPFVDCIRLNFAAAVIAAPPVVILDDCTAYQKFSVRRSMYTIINSLRNQGHAIIMSSGSVESHMPITDRLAIMRDGTFFDMDNVDRLIERYSGKGYTVVVHLKNEVNIHSMFAKYFTSFVINDSTEVLVNVQIKDTGLTWTVLFEKMEALKENNHDVYSYIVTEIAIDYVYNSIMAQGPGITPTKSIFSWKWFRKILSIQPEIMPKPKAISKLVRLEGKYGITKLKELPWSVIFHR